MAFLLAVPVAAVLPFLDIGGGLPRVLVTGADGRWTLYEAARPVWVR